MAETIEQKHKFPDWIKDPVKENLRTARTLYSDVPPFFPFSTVAPTAPERLQGRQMLQGINFPQLLDEAQQGISGFLSGDFLDPNRNPALQQNIRSAIRPVRQQFKREVLPGIDAQAESLGTVGGSQKAIERGLATEGFGNAIGDIAGDLVGQNYAQALGIQGDIIGNLPNIFAGLGTPTGIFNRQADTVEGEDQQLIDAARQRYDYETTAPYQYLRDYNNLLLDSNPGATIRTQQPGMDKPGTFQQILAIASQLLGLGSGFRGLF